MNATRNYSKPCLGHWIKSLRTCHGGSLYGEEALRASSASYDGSLLSEIRRSKLYGSNCDFGWAITHSYPTDRGYLVSSTLAGFYNYRAQRMLELPMPYFSRSDLLMRFRSLIRENKLIVGGGAGTGLSAKSQELGGVDLLILYNSGRYRMAGRGSLSGMLAYGNANEIVVEMGREVLPVVRNVPVIAGVNGTDPFCNMEWYLEHLKALGFSGVQNFPSVGLIDGLFRRNLEETGMGYSLEVEMIRLANQKNLLTSPYVFCEEEARAMTHAGADIIVCHMGLTVGGNIGAESACTLEESVTRINHCAEAALKVRDDVIVLAHGGPISLPEHVQYILDRCPNCHGFYGASSMERLPVESAIAAQIRSFKNIRVAR